MPRLRLALTGIEFRSRTVVLVLLVAGFAVRMALLPFVPNLGPQDLFGFYIPWMEFAVEHGLFALYRDGPAAHIAIDYPPVVPALLYAFGLAGKALLGGLTQMQAMILCKLPGALADLAVALQIIRLMQHAERMTGPAVRLAAAAAPVAAALWLFNPAILYDSAAWGQCDSVLVAFLLGALDLGCRRRWGFAGALTAAALLTKPQAMMALPAFGILALADGGLLATLSAAAGAIVVGALILAPFAATEGLGTVIAPLTGAIGFYDTISADAYNIWWIVNSVRNALTRRWEVMSDTVAVAGPLTAFDVGLLILLAYVSALCGGLWTRLRAGRGEDFAERLRVVALAVALLYFGCFCLGTQMHERYVLPALGFLVFPALYGRDRSIWLAVFLVLTATSAASLLLVQPPSVAIAEFVRRHQVIKLPLAFVNVGVLVFVGYVVCSRMRRAPPSMAVLVSSFPLAEASSPMEKH